MPVPPSTPPHFGAPHEQRTGTRRSLRVGRYCRRVSRVLSAEHSAVVLGVVIAATIISGCGSAGPGTAVSSSPPLTDASTCQAFETASTSLQDAYAAQIAPQVDPPSAGTGAAVRDAYAFGYIGGRCHREAKDGDGATITLTTALGLQPLTSTSTCREFEMASWSVQNAYAAQVAPDVDPPSAGTGAEVRDAYAFGYIGGHCHRDAEHGDAAAATTLAVALGLSATETGAQAGATETSTEAADSSGTG